MTAPASRTAVLVCQGRAVAHDRLGLHDPTAYELLRPDEQPAVDRARGAAPSGGAARLEWEMLNGTAEIMAPRTLAIDEAIRTAHQPQLVILGAGLDGRAYRMPELSTVDVYEVDQPASQQDKRDRLGDLRPTAQRVRFVPVDFRVSGALGRSLDAAGHDATRPTTWVWEGVVPYLTPAAVKSTVDEVAARSRAGGRLIVNYQARSLAVLAGRAFSIVMAAVSRQPNPLRGEPWRSTWTPATMEALLAGPGLRVERDDDLLTLAHQLGTPATHRRSLRDGRVAVADRTHS